jgi:hypothetical protein
MQEENFVSVRNREAGRTLSMRTRAPGRGMDHGNAKGPVEQLSTEGME